MTQLERKAWKDKNFEQECKNKAPGRRNQNWDGKIPIEDKIELEKKENEKIEQEQIRQVMWKLRKKEKKFIQTDETRKIQNMAKQGVCCTRFGKNENELSDYR